ncbi:MAG TPA: UDP-N-acetylmuramoyl-L-alanyl-D-glutamate--2,6-diaminopimelate ligase [Gemmatimonadaceae bacterium]|nr:UDP-N-acetylmuramoyl-L-alanyl-D-glutamate--2,6-diaminopimelate ligase [Gemmatimonadaceae bacterium]
MTAVPLSSIREALSDARILIGERGELPERVSGLAEDSRLIAPGALFIAVRGSERDGHEYLGDAQARGAAAAIVEEEHRTTLPSLVVRDGRLAAALSAGAFYGHPAQSLQLIAVTGTNGKTTTAGILRHLLDESGAARSASIGTLGVLLGSQGETMPGGSGLTTPGPVELQRVLRALVDRGVRAAAMEVSSHSLDQRRVEGLAFAAAVFTNLTHDHLDYHTTMQAYFAAKARLIAHLKPAGVAVVNADDAAWNALPEAPRRVTFGVASPADVSALGVRSGPRGSDLTLVLGDQRHELRLPLIGDFNVANALGAGAAAWALGMSGQEVAARLATVPQVPGRLEILHEGPTVLRDYAHTPDALERALRAIRPFARRKLTVVFGCGGDRDRGKRPVMGAIAAKLADYAILTSDNPRTEDPERILDEIEEGMNGSRHERVEDRRSAIARAIELSGPDDIVLLAGKGHETYQIRGDTRYPFDEREIVRELFGARAMTE